MLLYLGIVYTNKARKTKKKSFRRRVSDSTSEIREAKEQNKPKASRRKEKNQQRTESNKTENWKTMFLKGSIKLVNSKQEWARKKKRT